MRFLDSIWYRDILVRVGFRCNIFVYGCREEGRGVFRGECWVRDVCL